VIQKDKLLHIIVGALIVFGLGLFINVYIAMAVCMLIAFGKEYLYDIRFPKKHSVELLDVVFTVFGGFIALLFFL
jgi:phage shock protein PspC (stress-responsive transcriptional regulator)